ncbi:hypothetical protein BDM02DRAFT_2050570 [Thelephora ganbajun]|uniref:Uncharacterized protein n=1 Tax=Thelephora ganbajun TaxID=370292 RepID=A0ACB6YZA9_THEGA|nr:hypothetical protein BDM02DRAFT_2050570 [Thelephora ganbajun]
MGNLPLDKAYLTAIWLETLFYGINFTLCWICGYVLIKKKKKIPWIMLAVVIFQWMLSTVHVSLGFTRLIYGFIYYRNGDGGPAAYFSNISIPGNVAKVFIHTLNTAVGDGVVVWRILSRCYLVWGKSWKVVIPPLTLLCGFIVSGIGQTYHFARGQDIHSAFQHTLTLWNGLVFSFSLATNITATSLIALRVWYVFRMISGVTRNLGTAKILVLVIESGMIYSAALIIEIACYFAGSNAFYILYDPIAQLTSIVPTMILLLVGFRQTSNDIRTRANATTKPRTGASTLPTVDFRTNPDLTATTDPRTMNFSAPKVTFGSLNATSESESASKLSGFKTEVVDFDPQVSTNSEKNV